MPIIAEGTVCFPLNGTLSVEKLTECRTIISKIVRNLNLKPELYDKWEKDVRNREMKMKQAMAERREVFGQKSGPESEPVIKPKLPNNNDVWVPLYPNPITMTCGCPSTLTQ